MTTAPNREQLAPTSRIWQTGLLAGVVASIVNLIIYAIASAAGVSFDFMPAEIPAPPFAIAVVFATLVGVLAGTFLLTLMPRFTARPVTMWRNIAIIALILSFIQPLSLTSGMMPTAAPVGLSTVLALEIMHIVAGVVAIYLLTTRARA